MKKKETAFWSTQATLFDTASESATTREEIVAAVLSKSGIGAGVLKACLSSGEGEEIVDADVKAAVSLDIRMTPTMFVNGRKVEGMSEEIVRMVLAEVAQEAEVSDKSSAGGWGTIN